MKPFAAATILLLLMPGFSLAANEPSFEGGQKEVVAVLAAPGYEATVNLEIPAGYYVTNATMNVTGMAAENNASAYPQGVSIRINDSTVWGFQNAGFGPMGMQDRFTSEKKQVTSTFGANGGNKTQYIRLPKEATVQSAEMAVRGSPPLTGTMLWNKTGTKEKEELGGVLSMAGDVNGDGYGDIIFWVDGGIGLFYGGAIPDNGTDLIFKGDTEEWFGFSVSGGGDVNNDGYDDVIIGAPYNTTGGTMGGAVYIYLGGQNMDTKADIIITSPSANSRLGMSVSNAGDVNGDGYDDVLVGTSNTNWVNEYAYIYYGGQNMDNIADLTLEGNATGWRFSYRISGAGDINGDKYDDVIIGGWNGAADAWVYIFFGGQQMNNQSDVILKIPLIWGRHSYTLSGAGDVNGDGYKDVTVGAYQDSSGGDCAGKVYIFYGNSTMDVDPDIICNGTAGDNFGNSVSGGGDLDSDGYDDVIIGAYGADDWNGAAYVLFGGNPMNNISDYNFSEPTNEGKLGSGVCHAGDVNGDGYGDFVVSAPDEPFNVTTGKQGIVYVLTMHVSNLIGILNPAVSIGPKNIWNGMGYINGTSTVGDFSGVLNSFMASAPISGVDSYGNSYVDIPVNLNASSEGILTLSNLTIEYSYTAHIRNFTSVLGDFLNAHQDQKNANGSIDVPIKIHSTSAGRVKLSGLKIDISLDLPPALITKIGDFELAEDSWNSSLTDLYTHFQDDLDSDTLLNFSIASRTNSSYVAVGIRNKRYLAADAFSGDANDNWTGTVEVVVACSDHWGHRSESNKFTITVKNVNDEPIITSTPAFKAEAGIPYYCNVTAIDGDNDSLKFSLPKAPTGMTIDATTGRIQWLPRAGGTHNVTVNVSDGIASTEQRFSIFVPNKAPRITSQPELNGTTGVAYSYNVTTEDDNRDALKFSLKSSIIGMVIDSINGTISWTPTYANNYDVVVVVSDGNATATQEFTVTVVQGNRPPRFVSAPVKTATVGLPYEYQARGTDEDGDVLGFWLIEAPTGMMINGTSGKVLWTPMTAGNFPVKIKIIDWKGGDAVQEFSINVADKVKAKVMIDKPAENGKVKGKTTFSGTAIKGTLEVTVVQVRIDGGEWTNVTGNYSWQYMLDTTKLKNGKHKLEARASDGKDYSDIVERQFAVDNQKAQGKGLIPGFEAGILLLVVVVLAPLAFGRRRLDRGDFP